MIVEKRVVAERMARIVIDGTRQGLIRTSVASPLVERIRTEYQDALPEGRFGPEITVPLSSAIARDKFSRNLSAVIAEATALAGDIRRGRELSHTLSTLRSFVSGVLEIEADVRIVLSVAGLPGTERPLDTQLQELRDSILPLKPEGFQEEPQQAEHRKALNLQIAMLAEVVAYGAATLYEASELLLMAMRGYVRVAHPNLTGNDAFFPFRVEDVHIYMVRPGKDPATVSHLLRCVLKFGDPPYSGMLDTAERMAAWLVENETNAKEG